VKQTILVADDDPDFALQLRVQLEAAGFAVRLADSAAAALASLDEALPDLAILDLMMENVDSGFALCYAIKKRRADLPIILVTAVTAETGMEFGAATDEERSWVKADAMLAKPVRGEQLLREVHRLLAR
jgi:CheY-like chemotaxis protein